MSAHSIHATDAAIEAAWGAYAEHRGKEEREPALADDPAHVAEGRRLHVIFSELYTGERQSVVLPFVRRKG